MNILIENSGYHLRNLGDVAMLQAACAVIKRIQPEAQLQVFTTAPDRLLQLCPGVEALAPSGQAAWQAAKYFPIPRRCLPLALQEWIFRKEKDFKYAQPIRALGVLSKRADYQAHHAAKVEAWIAAIEGADAVIVTGGGFFTDAFGSHLEGLLHTLCWARAKKRMTAFFGQGLGPLDDPRLRRLGGVALREADLVTLRENRQGLALGTELQCETQNWLTTGDDAFALLTSVPANPAQGQSIGINLRVADYSAISSGATAQLAEALEAVRVNYDATWMPLPVDLCPDCGDSVKTLSLLKKESVSAVYQLPETPMDLFDLVGDCRVVITGSYHAAVFALARGVPVVGLAANPYYTDKFNGLAGFFPSGLRIVDHSKASVRSELLEAVTALWRISLSDRLELCRQAQAIGDSVVGAYKYFMEELFLRIGLH